MSSGRSASRRVTEVARRAVWALPGPVRDALRPLLSPIWARFGPPDERWRHLKYEPSVQLAMKDLVRPGSVAFDVGANLGYLTSHLSRLVGPTGSVHAFEAHPGCADGLRTRLRAAGLANCTVVVGAVVDRGGGTIDLFLPASPLDCSSTVVRALAASDGRAPESLRVGTLSLDDYCLQSGAWPELVKLDIEGAELLALQGFQRGLEQAPHFILEHGNDQSSPASALTAPALLEQRGYALFDLHTCRRTSAAECGASGLLHNLAAVHEAKLSRTPLAALGLRPRGSIELRPRRAGGTLEAASQPQLLEAGRYHASFNTTGLEESGSLGMAIEVDGRREHRVHGPPRLMLRGYADTAFELEVPSQVTFVLESDALTPESVRRVDLSSVVLGQTSG